MKNPFHLQIKLNRVRVKDRGVPVLDERFKDYDEMKLKLKKLEEKYG